jgi:hypothetical protein
MAATWTQDDVDALKKAVASGARRVKFKDREVEYQSLAQMRALLASMQQDVAAAAGKPSYTRISTRKGFDQGSAPCGSNFNPDRY